MTIELPAGVEKELEDLAVMQHRDIGELLEEAIRLYLETAAISDLDSLAIGEAQIKLAAELRDADWQVDREAIKVALDVQ